MSQITVPSSTSRAIRIFGIGLYILTTLFMSRLIVDIGTRMVFPFIPQLSSGLGLSVGAFGWLLAIRSLAGVASPLLGLLSDRYGRRKLMAVGLIGQMTGILGLALGGRITAPLAMGIYGLAASAYIPAQQAYISDQVPYERRGRTLASIEVSWATAAIIFLPIIGWLIDGFGWRFPFYIMGLFSLLGAALVWFRLPPVEHRSQTNLSWAEVKSLCTRLNVMASISLAILVFFTTGAFLTIWGIWLTHDFGIGAIALGWIATGIGIAEAAGSLNSSLFIDRLGKKRGSIIGLLITALFSLLIPLTRLNFALAVGNLILLGLFIEFTIVSLIPIYSEQAPEARGTALALALLGASVGMATGTSAATGLWEFQGLLAVCLLMAGALLFAVGILWKLVPETSEPPPPSKQQEL